MKFDPHADVPPQAAAGHRSPERPADICGVDFGTSNSAAAVAERGHARVLGLQEGRTSIPTAVFFSFDDGSIAYGREAMRRHLAHDPGRLMRSLKSILGTTLFEEKTQVRLQRYLFADIVAGFLRFLRQACTTEMGEAPRRVVLGRTAFFVDDDLGGGTSDFSVVRVSPERGRAADRKADILSWGGIHIGGTDFDRLLSLATLMPLLGFRSRMKAKQMEVPSWYYHDLSTWHRVNALYDPKVLPDMRRVRREAVEPEKLDRLLDMVKLRKGHELLGRVEDAKIALSAHDRTALALADLTAGLTLDIAIDRFEQAIGAAIDKVIATARDAVCQAGLAPGDIDTVFLTGGSSGIPKFKAALAAAVPAARVVEGDAFGSVATGLALDAERKFGRSG